MFYKFKFSFFHSNKIFRYKRGIQLYRINRQEYTYTVIQEKGSKNGHITEVILVLHVLIIITLRYIGSDHSQHTYCFSMVMVSFCGYDKSVETLQTRALALVDFKSVSVIIVVIITCHFHALSDLFTLTWTCSND